MYRLRSTLIPPGVGHFNFNETKEDVGHVTRVCVSVISRDCRAFFIFAGKTSVFQATRRPSYTQLNGLFMVSPRCQRHCLDSNGATQTHGACVCSGPSGTPECSRNVSVVGGMKMPPLTPTPPPRHTVSHIQKHNHPRG